ncbi:hypothetical protein ABNX05_05360 [Lysinibacillus sp. M3]|uniref:Uncharacterized protein n=1 Tax=Lysinibacillus zambalensis TaxID=3160866 RepID=A0ABV1MNF4_9BACI
MVKKSLLSFVYLSFGVMIKMDINNKLHIKSSMDIKQHLNERDGKV